MRKYGVLIQYSIVVEVEADNEDGALELALDSAPTWVSDLEMDEASINYVTEEE